MSWHASCFWKALCMLWLFAALGGVWVARLFPSGSCPVLTLTFTRSRWTSTFSAPFSSFLQLLCYGFWCQCSQHHSCWRHQSLPCSRIQWAFYSSCLTRSQQCLTSALPVSQTTASAHASLTVGCPNVSPNWPFLPSLLFWFLSSIQHLNVGFFQISSLLTLHALPSILFRSHGFRYHLYANDCNLNCISANLRHRDCKMHWDFVYHKERQKHKHCQLNDAMASCHINHKIHFICRNVRMWRMYTQVLMIYCNGICIDELPFAEHEYLVCLKHGVPRNMRMDCNNSV